ncbi:ParB/RepB/Spo0J family partition protein [Deinococcus hopiensis]|uniref:Chromosome partitioning protein, ParB family n=1 Tax=Deinococcus hopiensis KR-140 TaxID=695939 RepID=A0A1W1UPH2_9DEIO|nr:ParB/RepB/Spo0J family partition protein [Deinococcus hopiensis]SMB82933.1 chromosome partitioning protein, ParB family [Deinococcus hopiensis KR-140]
MSRKRPPLKADLGALLGETAALGKAALPTGTLPIGALRPGASQPRRAFSEAGLAELAASMRERGVLQPLLVRPVEDGHEIVAGERRWRAAQLAGLTEVPVVIRTFTDQEARAAALVENLQREDLNIIDEVDGKLDLVAVALGLPREEARSRLIRLTKEEPGEEAEVLTALFAPLRETWTAFAKNKLRVLNWPPTLLGALRGGLPYTLAGVIAAAPEEHHAALIALAQNGASRSNLRAEADRLGKPVPVEETSRATRVAQKLGSRRFLAGLDPQAKKAIDRWLDRMPEPLRQALEAVD